MAWQFPALRNNPKLLKFLALSCLISAGSASHADGIANYASYLDTDSAAKASAALQAQLGTEVFTSEATVNGQRYLRLQSAVQSDWDARGLVKRAKTAGYDAWFQSAPAAAADASQTASAELADAPPLALEPTEPVTPKPTVSKPTLVRADFAPTTPVALTSANPKLAASLPEGPLLGDLYPPRKPRSN